MSPIRLCFCFWTQVYLQFFYIYQNLFCNLFERSLKLYSICRCMVRPSSSILTHITKAIKIIVTHKKLLLTHPLIWINDAVILSRYFLDNINSFKKVPMWNEIHYLHFIFMWLLTITQRVPGKTTVWKLQLFVLKGLFYL